MLMGVMQLGWDFRGAANTFLEQLTEWERRIQEYEGESLETFSDGMKIAVMASHAPESTRNMARLAACPAKWKVARQNMSEFLQFGRIFDKGVESESSSAGTAPMDVDAVGKGNAAKDCRLNQGKDKGQSKGQRKSTTDKSSTAKIEGECRHHDKKGHRWADCWKRLAEARTDGAPSTASVAAVEDAEFAPLDSVCEEHICPWSFAEGGFDLAPRTCS